MKIYRLEWYLPLEERKIIRLYANQEAAEEMYKDLKGCLDRGSRLSLWELTEDEQDHLFIDSEILHHNEF